MSAFGRPSKPILRRAGSPLNLYQASHLNARLRQLAVQGRHREAKELHQRVMLGREQLPTRGFPEPQSHLS